MAALRWGLYAEKAVIDFRRAVASRSIKRTRSAYCAVVEKWVEMRVLVAPLNYFNNSEKLCARVLDSKPIVAKYDCDTKSHVSMFE